MNNEKTKYLKYNKDILSYIKYTVINFSLFLVRVRRIGA